MLWNLSSSGFDFNHFKTNNLFIPGSCRAAGDGTDRSMCQANRYLYSGFAALQTLIDSAVVGVINLILSEYLINFNGIRHHSRTYELHIDIIFQMNGATFPITNVSVQVMPKDPSVSNTDAFGIITPIYFVLAFSPLLTWVTIQIFYTLLCRWYILNTEFAVHHRRI